jgi:hypothetical protein
MLQKEGGIAEAEQQPPATARELGPRQTKQTGTWSRSPAQRLPVYERVTVTRIPRTKAKMHTNLFTPASKFSKKALEDGSPPDISASTSSAVGKPQSAPKNKQGTSRETCKRINAITQHTLIARGLNALNGKPKLAAKPRFAIDVALDMAISMSAGGLHRFTSYDPQRGDSGVKPSHRLPQTGHMPPSPIPPPRSPVAHSRPDTSPKKGQGGSKLTQTKGNRKGRSQIEYLKRLVIVNGVRDFLCFRDYYAYLLTSRQVYRQKYLNKKIVGLIIHGLRPAVRERLWAHKGKLGHTSARFTDYLRKNCAADGDIEKDLDRTFAPEHAFYSRTENRQYLKNILHAFTVKNPEVGYIQGLNFIAGRLLLIFPQDVNHLLQLLPRWRLPVWTRWSIITD